MSILVEDENKLNLLVERKEKVIAYYPLITVKLLKENFKKICSTQEFSEYESLDDFVNSIYFFEFLEYFLDYLHSLFPDVISYEKYKTNTNSVIIKNIYFRDIIEMCSKYVFNYINIDTLYTQLQHNINSINHSTVSSKLKKALLRLYYGLLYFTKSVMNKNSGITDFLQNIKNAVIHGSNKVSIDKSIIMNSCSKNFILELKKNLLSKFRLFQRKYLSQIAKLRKIGPPEATNKESREIKKELNKNKNIDYKAYEVFCKYVLSKEENEDIYDYLAGIHKNTFKGVIHKNINNNTVANIKANTKEKHHKEYLERSEAILKRVEAKIEKHGDIIDIKTKGRVKAIRALFDSKQFKNMTFSFGSNLFEQKIIKECKTIRVINKEIDKMIKKHMKKEQKQRKQDKEKQMKQVNNKNTTTSKFLSDLLEKHPEIKKEPTQKKQIHKLLLKYHPNKRQGLTNNERKATEEITFKLTQLLKSS